MKSGDVPATEAIGIYEQFGATVVSRGVSPLLRPAYRVEFVGAIRPTSPPWLGA
ncbi:MAG: hypothetical protein ABSD97_10715 [Acidimicrobiales bacterium]|jgi:hypothetical protein